ncbi:galactosyltransferase-related protein [Jannaschia sp. R86511]|uniref:galactosyltransferase-related protein n=1 Tax=Jannaschia sp. R86511 TaxID=3093853 RepID=UPI0036D393D3
MQADADQQVTGPDGTVPNDVPTGEPSDVPTGGPTGVPAGAPTTVVTIVRGRLDHLRRQAWGLARQQDTAFGWVVVRMGGPDVREAAGQDGLTPVVVDLPVPDGEPLPLAAARNAGVAAAAAGGTVVLLDVDVVPAPDLVGTYVDAVRRTGGVVAGPVGYLPPDVPTTRADLAGLAGHAEPHPARPVPAPGELLAEDRWELLWTLSLAAPVDLVRAVGGFDERYVGYGGEDTDFAMRLRRAGASLHWVGGAMGYHQHHAEVGRRDKVPDVVRNATLFHRTWGWWPMAGWLADLAAEGVVEWQPDGDVLRLR